MFRSVIVAAFLLMSAAAIDGASAEELIRYNSASTPPTAFQIKRAKAKGVEPETKPGDEIVGTLRIPVGDTPLPAVVMIHSCRGVLPYLHDWAEFLTGAGFVTLIVDSYSTRDITDECATATAFERVDKTPDIYGSLQYLAALDAVDGDRIGVLGWGQTSAVVGSMTVDGPERFYEQKFRAAIGFYTGCRAFTEGRVYAPTLLLNAGKDGWIEQVRCSQSIAAGQKSGSPISLVEYPNAFHGFDDPGVGEETYLEVPTPYKTPSFGVTLRYNGEAHAHAREQVKLFLNQNLSAE